MRGVMGWWVATGLAAWSACGAAEARAGPPTMPPVALSSMSHHLSGATAGRGGAVDAAPWGPMRRRRLAEVGTVRVSIPRQSAPAPATPKPTPARPTSPGAPHGRQPAGMAPATRSHAVAVTVPAIAQVGEIANCGPTAAAMILAPFRGLRDASDVAALRDAIGAWSWDAFPQRRRAALGQPAGATTADVLAVALARYGEGVAFGPVSHPWLPAEAYGVLALAQLLAQGRPVVALTQASTLWGVRAPGLHWVVVIGIDEGGRIIFNDPAEGGRATTSYAQFWHAWRLSALYRRLPGARGFTAIAPDRAAPGHR